MPSLLSPQRFQQIVLKWYDRYGRKNFPWQQDKTPYRVWVSEIMLQQTQVTTVIPYFQRFIARFPTITDLAKAPEDEALHLWAGLGYYSRARNLHRSAKIIQQEWQGNLPNSIDELQKLPGIGRSTAGAIVSCAFHQKATILDGNVKRLLARLHGIAESIDTPKIQSQLWELAENYTPEQRIADYTQAMMDFGATLCTRTKPRCLECPLSSHCLSHQQGIAEQLPRKKTKKTIPIRAATFLILQNNDKVLLEKRPPTGIWGGLWSLPQLADKPLLTEIKHFCLNNFQLQVKNIEHLTHFRHTFSHFHLDIYPIRILLKTVQLKLMDCESRIWYSLNHPGPRGLPAPIQTLLKTISNH